MLELVNLLEANMAELKMQTTVGTLKMIQEEERTILSRLPFLIICSIFSTWHIRLFVVAPSFNLRAELHNTFVGMSARKSNLPFTLTYLPYMTNKLKQN